MLMVGAKCDKCGVETVRYGHTTKGDITRIIRAKGWSVGKGDRAFPERTLCPRCRKTKKNGGNAV